MKFFKMLSFCLLVAVFSIGATKSVKRDTELSAEVDKLIDTELAVVQNVAPQLKSDETEEVIRVKISADVGTNTAVRHTKPIIPSAIKIAGKILMKTVVCAAREVIKEGAKAMFNEITN